MPQWQIYWEQEGGKLWRLWMAGEGPSGTCPSLLSLSSSSPLDYLSTPLPLSFHDISPSSAFQASTFNKNNTQIVALPFFPSSALPPVFSTHNKNDVSAINWIGGYWKTNFTNNPDDFHSFVLTPPQPSTCLEMNEKNAKKSPIAAMKKHHQINKNNKNADKKKKYQGVTGFSRVGGNNNVPNCADIKSLYWYFAYNVYPTHSDPTASACDYSCSDYTEVQDSDLGMTGTDAAYICTPSQTALAVDSSLPTLVAFSGSANTVDWLEDFNIIGVQQFGMTTHAGFYHKFSLWQKWLDSYSSTLLSTSTPIIFTGHSMGGAIANVAAVYWKNRYPSSTVALQTFGAPSSFQKPFSSVYQSIPNTRYVNFKQGCGGLTPNEQDPVPVVAEIASYFHPVAASALTETCTGWSNEAITITPVIGDLDFSLHTQYGEFTDDVNP